MLRLRLRKTCQGNTVLTEEDELRLAPGPSLRAVPFIVEPLVCRPFQTVQARVRVSWGAGDEGNRTESVVCTRLPVWEVGEPIRDEHWHLEKGAVLAMEPALKQKLQATKWKGLTDASFFSPAGYIDFLRVFPRSSRCRIFARTRFVWPGDDAVPFVLRTDDQGALWCNGELTRTHLARGPADRYHAEATLPLRQGTNSVLLMVTQATGEWQASLSREPQAAERGEIK